MKVFVKLYTPHPNRYISLTISKTSCIDRAILKAKEIAADHLKLPVSYFTTVDYKVIGRA